MLPAQPVVPKSMSRSNVIPCRLIDVQPYALGIDVIDFRVRAFYHQVAPLTEVDVAVHHALPFIL